MRSKLDSIPSPKWIELAFCAKFNPARLAARCEVSLRQLERYFDEAFNLPPKLWLQRLRINAAAQMMMQRVSEKEAAFNLAFSSVPHLVREFRRHYGCTPTTYLQIESGRSAIRSGSSPEMRALEEEYLRAPVHPRDEWSLLYTHRRRTQRLKTGSPRLDWQLPEAIGNTRHAEACNLQSPTD